MAQITIADATPSVQYTVGSGGSTGPFTIAFPYFSTDDIKVYVDGTLKTITTHYTISGTAVDDGFSGGTVTFGSAVASCTVTIERDVAVARTDDFPAAGIFNIATLNTTLDKIFAIMQALENRQTNTLTRPITSTENYSMSWPEGATTEPKVLQVSSDAALELGPTTGEISAAATQATAAATSATAAAGSATTAAGHVTTASNYAVKVDGVASGSDHSSKAWAIGGTGVTDTAGKGAAKEWATEAEDNTVDGSEYSAKHYSIKASAQATVAEGYAQAAASGQLYSTVENKSSNFTVGNGDDGKYFIVDTSGGPVTGTLSAIGSDDGRRFAFQKSSASNSLIFDPQSTDTVNGSASNYTITENSEVVILVADNGGADDSSADNWIATIQSQTVAGAGLSKRGSPMTLDLTKDQAWTGSQRSTPVTDNDGSFDMNAGNNFNWTPSGADVIEFTNETAGQGGLIYLVNGSGHAITKGSEVKCDANFLATVSAAGNYLISYYSFDGTSVVVANTLAVS